MPRLITSASIALFAMLGAGCASRSGPSADSSATASSGDFQRQLSGFIDRLRADPSAPPGFVVVAVDRAGPPSNERTAFAMSVPARR